MMRKISTMGSVGTNFSVIFYNTAAVVKFLMNYYIFNPTLGAEKVHQIHNTFQSESEVN